MNLNTSRPNHLGRRGSFTLTQLVNDFILFVEANMEEIEIVDTLLNLFCNGSAISQYDNSNITKLS